MVASAKDGYRAVFSLAELDPASTANDIIVADTVDGKPLFDYQGALRIVVPHDKRGARSVRIGVNTKGPPAHARSIADGPYRGIGYDNPNKSPVIRGFTLMPDQTHDLVAFLQTLTDVELLNDPGLSDPWMHQGQEVR